jgi:hypothetical protein
MISNDCNKLIQSVIIITARVNTKATPMKTTNKLLSLGLWDPHSTSIDDNIPVDMAEEMLLR